MLLIISFSNSCCLFFAVMLLELFFFADVLFFLQIHLFSFALSKQVFHYLYIGIVYCTEVCYILPSPSLKILASKLCPFHFTITFSPTSISPVIALWPCKISYTLLNARLLTFNNSVMSTS